MPPFVALAGVLQRHRVAVGILGLVLLLSGAWTLTSAYHAPIPHQDVDSRTLWTEEASFTYEVPVTRNSTHLPIGTVLPMGEPAYFRTVSDHVVVHHAWHAEGPADLRGVAASRLVIDIRAQSEDGRPYWALEHTLGETTTQDPATGTRLDVRVDLDALSEEVRSIDQELPAGQAVLNWTVRAIVTYALDMGGESHHATVEHLLPITMQEPRFILPAADALAWEDAHRQEEVRTFTSPAGARGALASLRGIFATGLGLALVGLALWATQRPLVDPFEAEYARFRDWVSAAERLPESATRGPHVEVSTLEDLVHIAADARARVVLDATHRVFYVLLPGTTYRYSSHSATRPVPVPEVPMALARP